eukprot:126355-Chlamydomonas_euryale.AAC.3
MHQQCAPHTCPAHAAAAAPAAGGGRPVSKATPNVVQSWRRMWCVPRQQGLEQELTCAFVCVCALGGMLKSFFARTVLQWWAVP